MSEVALIILLLGAVVLVVGVSRRLGQPYPILLVIGGLGLSLVPGLPAFELDPDLVFLLILPPILFAAGYFSSARELRRYRRPIILLAVGLVLFTVAVVGVMTHALIPELSWPAAFAFGAIVSPPDAIAATAVAHRLGVPRRIVTILEGESLVNDATALVAYRSALVVAATGVFEPAEALGRFVIVGLGGLGVGLLVGGAVVWILRTLDDAPVEIAISMLAPFAAYLPAEELGVSGVIATVVAGVLLGSQAPRMMSSRTRVQGQAAWEMLLFALNGVAFILIGLQLPEILASISDRSTAQLLGFAAAVSLTVVGVRLLWVYPAAYLPRLLVRSIREGERAPTPAQVAVVGWSGMRGVVSLASALALPLTIAGEAFPARDLLIFLTFCVILVTLVGQGLTLPWLIRRLGVVADSGADHEEIHARTAAAEAALERLDELAVEWPDHRPLIDQLRSLYEHRVGHQEHSEEGPLEEHDQEEIEHQKIRRSVIDAERESLLTLRDQGAISDEALRRVFRDLDLDELRMEA